MLDGLLVGERAARATGKAPIMLGLDAKGGLSTRRLLSALAPLGTAVIHRAPGGKVMAEAGSLIRQNRSLRGFHIDEWLRSPSYAVPLFLERSKLSFENIELWEVHEAFAAQVLANIAALEKPGWIAQKVGIKRDFGPFPWESVNPNGGSLAIGHPFGATGARDLSQAVKELALLPRGSRAIVSVCADGGHGVVALLENC